MEDFYIDKGCNEDEEESVKNCVSDTFENNIFNLDELPPLQDYRKSVKNAKVKEFSLNDTYLITNYTKSKENNTSGIQEVIKKFRILPGLEKEDVVKSMKTSRLIKKERKMYNKQTKGEKWFNMQAAEITPEIKNDIEILKMRAVLDKKHVYKKNDTIALPKYLQVGIVVESPADFYSGRIVKSERKKTIVDELLADAECRRYQKNKYKEILDNERKKFRQKHNTLHMKRKNAKGRKRIKI